MVIFVFLIIPTPTWWFIEKSSVEIYEEEIESNARPNVSTRRPTFDGLCKTHEDTILKEGHCSKTHKKQI